MGLFAFVCPFVYCCARVRIEMAGEMRKKLYREYRFLIPPGAVATLWCCLLFARLKPESQPRRRHVGVGRQINYT